MCIHDDDDDRLTVGDAATAILMALALLLCAAVVTGCEYQKPPSSAKAATLCPAGGCVDCKCQDCKADCAKKIVPTTTFPEIVALGKKMRAEAEQDSEEQPLAIKAEPTIEAGNLLLLEATGNYSNLKWRCLPPTKNFASDGKKAYFCAPTAGTWHIVLSGWDGSDVGDAIHEVTVTGGPAPPPGPQPKPVPSLKPLAAKWIATVQSPNKYAEAQGLAAAYEGIAAAVSAGTLKGNDAIVAELASKTRETLGLLAIPHWLPVLSPLRDELNARQAAGTLDPAQCIRELAEALKEVKPAVAPAPQPAKASTPTSRTQAQRAA